MSKTVWRALPFVGTAATAGALVFFVFAYHIDLDVYRIGARVLLSGGDLYGHLPATESGVSLGFTYPPIAAALFVPLALVPMPVAGLLLTLATFGALAAVMRITLPALGIRFDNRLLFLLGPIALLFEPIRGTLGYGQVNLLLMGLVVLDCLSPRPKWPRGLLIGIAAAIKLTPAVFVLFFLLRKDYRAAMVGALSFAGMSVIGFALNWRDSWHYWGALIFDPDRVGGVAYAANQSIQGVLARYGMPHATALWLLASVLVLTLAAVGMRRALASGAPTWALALNAFAGLLVSPISWSHHWVWIAFAVFTLLVLSNSTVPKVLALTGSLVFALGPHWLVPNGNDQEVAWSLGQQLLGNTYCLYALLVLVFAAVGGIGLKPRIVPELHVGLVASGLAD
ncbi:glycosyltransferase 87 family protein [Kutzneria albida]|uniref:Integral membrane protein n=1 Tax=Kutzneria albida DSM 43870 TaxID=1449976 RepID=W5WDB7_9PSEU|nr:glycosyltransferase 87 family protein [Kutzneria albida]AHH98867.1 hypothetical protein KALB_5505 [Kutzneria albida DSM 43870]